MISAPDHDTGAYERYASFISEERYSPCCRYLLDFVLPAKESLRKADAASILSEQALSDFSRALFYRLYRASFGFLSALTEEEISRRSPSAALDPSQLTAELIRDASEKALIRLRSDEALAENYPLFRQDLCGIADTFRLVTEEMLERILFNKSRIEARLLAGKTFSRITGLPPLDSDSHNSGRATTVVITDAGRFVYKPHDIRGDELIASVLADILPDTAYIPACVTSGAEYGFSEFIENRPASGRKEAGQFYYRMGKLTALLTVLGSSDLHELNMLASGAYPAPIDLEVLFSTGIPRVQAAYRNIFENTAAFDNLRSILHTGAMPHQPVPGREMSPLFDRSRHNLCAPVINGEKCSVCDFEEAFTDGFEQAYRCVFAKQEILMQHLDAGADVRYRIYFHNTPFYEEVLSKLSEPAAFVSAEKREAIVDRILAFGSTGSEAAAAAEKEALLKRDIPVYYLPGDSCDFWANGKIAEKNYYASSGIRNVKERLSRMSEKELAFEKKVIRCAVSCSVPLPKAACTGNAPAPLSSESLLAEAKAIFGKLQQCFLETPSGDFRFFGTQASGAFGMYPETLADGSAGIAVFAAALSAVTPDPSLKKEAALLADRCLRPHMRNLRRLREQPDAGRIYPPGLTGIGGSILSLAFCGKYLGCGDYEKEAAATAERLGQEVCSAERAFSDLYSGLAGLITVLCRFPWAASDSLVLCLAKSLSAMRTLPVGGGLWQTAAANRPISGAGHGMAGIAGAMWQAGVRTGEDSFKKDALAALEFERKIYSRSLGTWPDLRKSPFGSRALHGICSGAPGIGIIMLKMREAGCDEADELYRKALQACLAGKLQEKDHLCCGNAAVFEFLLTADSSENGSLREKISEQLREMLNRKNAAGDFTYGAARPPRPFAPGLFQGAAGIGYELLRYAFPDRIFPLF